jgi:hypothetical protein
LHNNRPLRHAVDQLQLEMQPFSSVYNDPSSQRRRRA